MNKDRPKSNQYLVWPPFAFRATSVHFEGTRLVGCSKNLGEPTTDHFVDESFLKFKFLISQGHSMMLRSGLCGAIPSLPELCAFLHAEDSSYCPWPVCLGSLSCCRLNLGPIRHLPDGIAYISACICQHRGHRESWPNLQNAAKLAKNLRHASLLAADTHYCIARKPIGKQTAFCYSQIFQMLTHRFGAPAAIILLLSSYLFVQNWVTWPCFHVGGMAFWMQLLHEDNFYPDLSW